MVFEINIGHLDGSLELMGLPIWLSDWASDSLAGFYEGGTSEKI